MKPILPYLKRAFIFCWILVVPATSLFSQNKISKSSAGSSWEMKPFERKAFIENKGQLTETLPKKYQNFDYSIDNGTQILFNKDGLTYVIKKYNHKIAGLLAIFLSEEKREELEHEVDVQTQYVSMKWLNANPDATIETTALQTTSYNYVIRPAGEKPYTEMCKGYSKIIYRNLYNGIDVEYFFTEQAGFKYNIIAQAGADISQVKLQYTGANGVSLKTGAILIKTLIGTIIDHAPVTYSTQNTNEKINSGYSLTNNIVSFNINNPNKQALTIDPWTLVPGLGGTPKAYDDGTDATGNVYVYGGAPSGFIVEKYGPVGGVPVWSLSNGVVENTYYGDMLVEGSGNFYLSEGFDMNGAHTYKYSTTSALVWTSTNNANFREHWRLAFNCITNKVIVAGGGTTTPTLNIAEIDVNTGTLVNAKSVYNQSQSDVAGLCVDDLGKAYLKHSNPNIITFTDNANNFVANIQDGYNTSEIGISTPTYYSAFNANGYNFMALGGTIFLFTSDGAEVKKWDRNTYALLGSVTIPGGQQNLGSGILADKCNNLFVGASNGVYRFDFNLVQKEYKATSTAVFDIAYAPNSDIIASGDGFVTSLPFGREACGANTILITNDPCDPEINTVKVRPTQGIPPFSFFWDDGNTDSIRTNLPMGDHIITVRDGACNPSFYTDTVKISDDTKALTVVKTNPLCNLSSNGEITITLLSNQQITNVTWTPAVTNSLLNDSTTKAAGLASGSYSCHLESSLGCSFDTTITLIAPPLLLDSVKSWNAKCPGDANGSAIVYAYGGTSPYTYSWATIPPQTTQSITGLITGKYIVTITDSNFCKKIDSVLIGSNPQPVISFTAATVCFGDTTTFTNTSTITTGTFNSHWLVGYNGDSATTTNTNYFYPLCTNYTATLTVTSDSACVATLTKTVVVSCKPTAAFTASDTVGCEPLCVSFQNLPLVPTGVNVQWAWSFGDESPVNTTQNPTHCYTNDSVYAPNFYTVSLTVTSDSGCTATVTKNNYITVYPNPNANFTVLPQTTTITDPVISFTNLSGGANFWKWNLGDTDSSSLQNPLPHTYADTGTYLVSLITSTLYGCIDTAYQTITIEPEFVFYIPNAFSPNDDGVNDTFTGKGIFIKEYEMRIFDRWGMLIFYTNDLTKPWDGKANYGSEIAQQDVYVWKVQLTDVFNKKHNYIGTVTLVKFPK